MSKCPDCQLAGRCVVEWTGHVAYCDWMRAGGAWRSRVVELSASPPGDDTLAPPRPESRPSAAESVRLVAAMKSCPFRAPDPGCGCSGGGRCALKRGASVNHQVCMSCVARYGA